MLIKHAALFNYPNVLILHTRIPSPRVTYKTGYACHVSYSKIITITQTLYQSTRVSSSYVGTYIYVCMTHVYIISYNYTHILGSLHVDIITLCETSDGAVSSSKGSSSFISSLLAIAAKTPLRKQHIIYIISKFRLLHNAYIAYNLH